jgi:hypothetical protein
VISIGLGEATEVRFTLSVPAPISGGNGWKWDVIAGGDDIGHDYAESALDLAALLRVWGSQIVRQCMAGGADMFALAAYSVGTGHILGRDCWQRSNIDQQLHPHGEPFCLWETPRNRLIA